MRRNREYSEYEHDREDDIAAQLDKGAFMGWTLTLEKTGRGGGYKVTIGDRVAENIRIRVTLQSVAVRDGHTAEDKWTVFCEAVDVIADAGHRRKWLI